MVLWGPGAYAGKYLQRVPLPAHSVVDGAPELLAEVGMGFGVVEGEVS